MQFDKSVEPTQEYMFIEMARAARKLVEEVFPVTPGESVVVTADSRSDWRVVRATLGAIYAAGAVPVLVYNPIVGEACSDPPEPVTAAIESADAWIEFNDAYFVYSNAWRRAMAAGVRYFTPGGDVDSLVKMVGQVNYRAMDRLAETILELSGRARQLRITSELGTDAIVTVDPEGSVGHVTRGKKGVYKFEGPGLTQWPPGLATVGHVPDGVDGVLVIDGTMWPPEDVGVLQTPVRLELRQGRITSISGGREAEILEKWFSSFNHDAVYEVAHCTYGLNPGVTKCKGDIGIDERLFGGIEFGFGPAWADSPGHTDGVITKPSIWADDVQLEENGRYVHPELVQLCREMEVLGY